MSEHDPLYEALVKYEDAANNVGSLTICTQGRYRALTDAIGGHGDILEARTAFEFEAKLLADAHNQWVGCALVVVAAISDGQEWSQSFAVPYKRCPQCGDAQKPGDPWVHPGGCDSCFDGQRPFGYEPEPVGNPFEEVARQSYGERGVVATEDIEYTGDDERGDRRYDTAADIAEYAE